MPPTCNGTIINCDPTPNSPCENCSTECSEILSSNCMLYNGVPLSNIDIVTGDTLNKVLENLSSSSYTFEEGCGDINITTNGNVVTFNDITYTFTTNIPTGLSIGEDIVNCVNTVTIDICPDSLPICSTYAFTDGRNGTNVVVNDGTTQLQQLLSTMCTSISNIANPQWANLTMTPSGGTTWSNVGGAFTTAQYMKDFRGMIYLEGDVVSSGTIPTTPHTIGVLPITHRPLNTKVFKQFIYTSGGTVLSDYYITVNASGLVQFQSIPTASTPGNHITVSLDGVVFFNN